MKVAVIGAGVSGLGAARTLQAGSHQVVVFERSTGPGGRVATYREAGYVFDTGATTVSPNGMPLSAAMFNELDSAGLVEVTKPVSVHSANRILAGDPARGGRRFVYTQGLDRLPHLLAQGLDVRYHHKIEQIEKADDGYLVHDEPFDAVIVTIPLPKAVEIAATARPRVNPGRASHRACLSIQFGFAEALETPHYATVNPEQNQPLIWLSVESMKCPGRAPAGCTAFVAQMGPSYSRYSYDHTDERIVSETLVDVTRLYGNRFSSPVVTRVKRWLFSQPEITVSFESVNPPGSKLLIAGDGVSMGRVEYAYSSGVHAAQSLMALP